MNWLLIVMVAGLIVVAGVTVNALVEKAEKSDELCEIDAPECKGSCSESENCGLSTCGAVYGGSCGCR